jgi:hypothetical protein
MVSEAFESFFVGRQFFESFTSIPTAEESECQLFSGPMAVGVKGLNFGNVGRPWPYIQHALVVPFSNGRVNNQVITYKKVMSKLWPEEVLETLSNVPLEIERAFVYGYHILL